MKAMLTFFAVLAMSIVEISAQTSGTTGPLSWTYDENLQELSISGTGDMPDYEFGKSPWEEYKENIEKITLGEGITNIGNNAFGNCVAITEIKIPNTATRIGESAFLACVSLESATIPGSVKTIDDGAFEDCTNLISLNLSEGLENIEGFAFVGCYKLEQLKLPATLINIGRWSFNSCIAIPSLDIPESVKTIGDNAFAGCIGLQSLRLSEGLETIDAAAFSGCEQLPTATIPASTLIIGAGIFNDCKKLTHITVKSGNSNYVDEDGILYDKEKKHLMQYPVGREITTFNIPENVSRIGDYAFGGCEKLTEIILPQQVKQIGTFAFARCSNVSVFNVPAGVEMIGESAFHDCLQLSAINVAKSNQAYISIDGVLYDKNQTTLLQYPGGKKTPTFIVPTSLQKIAGYAFFGNIYLTSVTLPANLNKIDTFAFGFCRNISSFTTQVADPASITLGLMAFFRGSGAVTCTLRVPAGSKDKYEAAEQWADFAPNIEEFDPVGIHQIENDAASTAGKQRIYDLNGNLQQGPLSKLPDGLYIINGKKIIKK